MKKGIFLGLLAAFAAMAGCASNPDKIKAAYVSPTKYSSYSCEQIANEMGLIGRQTMKLYDELRSERTADNWQLGVGLVFWPTLFLLEGGDGPEAAQYSQLIGEYQSLQGVSLEKNCGIVAQSPEEIVREKDDKTAKAVDDELAALHVRRQARMKEIAVAMACEEYVLLLSASDGKETWLLGCGNDKSIKVHCVEETCYVDKSAQGDTF